jgi:FixJ family two-component response regulator
MTDLADGRPALDRTVVIVDDDSSVRRALRRLFLSVGLNAVTFGSAEEFLQQSEIAGDCLVADVHLGRMNGLELQAELVRRADAIPLILVSGAADPQMEVEALRLGAIAFLRKPFNASVLLDAVMAGLDRQPTVEPRSDRSA